ncbi:MAG: DUF4372 domain-containing protein [Mangrovibacterium sp.]
MVATYEGDKHFKGFNSWSHLVSMLFPQLEDAYCLRYIGGSKIIALLLLKLRMEIQ